MSAYYSILRAFLKDSLLPLAEGPGAGHSRALTPGCPSGRSCWPLSLVPPQLAPLPRGSAGGSGDKPCSSPTSGRLALAIFSFLP